jgi:hypothetical protein
MANTFPTGVLRWTGDWSATTVYKYGDIALASTNVSYACGAVTSLNIDPATQPSTDWFPFPSDAVAGVTSLSGIQGVVTQSCVNGAYTVQNNDILLTIAYPTPPISSVSVTPDSGLTVSAGPAVVLASTVQTIGIETVLIAVDGTTSLWTLPFTPQGTGLSCVTNISINLSGNSFAVDSTLCTLELFYYETLAPTPRTSLGQIYFFRPPGAVGQVIGFNATYSRTISTFINTSYTFELEGTATSPTIGNPWTIGSRGFIQTGLPSP